MRFTRLSDAATAPKRAEPGSVGYDLSAARAAEITAYGGRAIVETDIAIGLPPGTYGRIAPRSGLAAKNGVDVLAGVIDPSYRGPVRVVLINHGNKDLRIKAGDRVAQLILERCETPDVEEVAELDETERGSGGFGSTGTA